MPGQLCRKVYKCSNKIQGNTYKICNGASTSLPGTLRRFPKEEVEDSHPTTSGMLTNVEQCGILSNIVQLSGELSEKLDFLFGEEAQSVNVKDVASTR
jgi:hypothetical protein